MSWSISPPIKAMPAAEAKHTIDAMYLPDCIKSYITAGIDGLIAHHGEDVTVTVDGHGHLCESKESYDVTTATLTVQREAYDAAQGGLDEG